MYLEDVLSFHCRMARELAIQGVKSELCFFVEKTCYWCGTMPLSSYYWVQRRNPSMDVEHPQIWPKTINPSIKLPIFHLLPKAQGVRRVSKIRCANTTYTVMTVFCDCDDHVPSCYCEAWHPTSAIRHRVPGSWLWL